MACRQRGRVWKVSCGAWHCAAITEYGHLLTWGGGDDGQLGLGDRALRCLPHTVRGFIRCSHVFLTTHYVTTH